MRLITPAMVSLLALAVLAAPGAASAQDWRSPYDRGARPGYSDNGYYRSYAFARGFDDGYREGLDDARDGDRYDPVREGRYRRGDRGYDRRYGPREFYKRDYREGFLAGYDRAFRQVASYYRRPGHGPRPAYPSWWRW
jgi:hypothetical protein